MNMKISILIFSAFLCFSTSLKAQYELSSFCNTGHGGATTYATDYQATGINPANLGWDYRYSEKKFAMGYTEFTGSIYSEALTKKELRSVIKDLFNAGTEEFNMLQKREAAKDFTKTGFSINANLGTIGLAFVSNHFGGIGFRVNDSYQAYCKLGDRAADLVFLGKTSSVFDSLKYIVNSSTGATVNIPNNPNMSPDSVNLVVSGYSSAPQKISEILNGSEMTYSWTREYNLSYGRKILSTDLISFFGGIGVKYFQGLALINVKSENNQLTGYSSLSPAFNIDYGDAIKQANVIKQTGTLPKPVGSGFGFDFGLNVIIKEAFKFGASFINAGSIKWDGNLYTVKDTVLFTTSSQGLENYNIFGQLKDVFGTKGLLKMEGKKEMVVKLPGLVRFGGSVLLGRFAELGFDCILSATDVPGKYNKPLIGFGGDFYPVKWLKIQAGYITGGNYKYSVPVGVIFIAKDGTYEAGIASRDAITFFTQSGPTLSLSMGFLRFRF
jgi:hypothetical protein